MSFTSNFCDQSPYTPNPQPEDKELSFEEVLNDLFRMGAENLKGMKQEEAKVEKQEEPDNDIDSIPIQVLDVMDDVIQPSIPQTIHTTPSDDSYDSPATDPILDELLEEFGDELLNITVDNEEKICNPTRDIEELELGLYRMIDKVFEVGIWMLLYEAFLEHVLRHVIDHSEQI
ncbi:hypothetical protein Tco_0290980 [Tanacetum coccineum]